MKNNVIHKEWVVKTILNDIKKKFRDNNKIVSILLRGSKSKNFFNKKYSDLDLSLILKEKHNVLDIIRIEKKLKKIEKNMVSQFPLQ